MSESAPWRDRTVHADRRPLLLARGRVKEALRGWFAGQGFTEIEAGILQISPGNETHLHGFATELIAPDGHKRPLFLQTSPEFACKKLLAAGETRIFDFARVFRNRESGDLHAPEFTMLEWYRVGETYEALMQDCADILRLAAEAAGARELRFRGRRCDPFSPPERITVAQAFADFAGVDLPASLSGPETDRDALAASARAAGVRVAEDDGWSDIFSRVLVQCVEPRLGEGRATLLADYPLAEAALARPKPGDPRFAERFELYACGVELANAFGELTDPAEQRRRFLADMDEKERLYGERYPLDEDFLAALAEMPEASGAALGFDRLIMLAAGAPRIADVQWTPLAR